MPEAEFRGGVRLPVRVRHTRSRAGEAVAREVYCPLRDISVAVEECEACEDYAGAAQAFDRPDDAQAQYNLGNTLAKQKKYPDAIAAYDRALKQQPDMDDAIANRKAVEDWLKQQKQQDKNKQDGQQGDKNDEQRQSGDDDAQQKSEQDQQQRSDRDSADKKQGDDQRGQNRQGGDQQDGKPQDGEDQQAGESQGQKDASSAKSNADNDKANRGKAGAQPDSKAAEERAQQQFQQSMDQALKNAGEPKEKKPVRLGAREDGATHDEKQQAVEQWLQRVPDDPGGLLRRKFQLESQHRQQGGGERQ